MVNKERVQLLVDALRSGKYAQGFGQLGYNLFGETKHCCLGVACEVARENGFELERHEDTRGDYAYGPRKLESLLPVQVGEWYGFGTMVKVLGEVDVALRLPGGDSLLATEMNDGDADFDRIADAFEYTFLKEEK